MKRNKGKIFEKIFGKKLENMLQTDLKQEYPIQINAYK